MSLQNPMSLLWFLPIGGAILALYLLRMRRLDVLIPSTFLWPDRVEEIRANSLFQKLRWNWLMFLQLVCAAFLCLAFARPQFEQKGLLGQTTVIIIDNSASMQATDVSPSRFEEAKITAIQSLQNIKTGDRVAVIEAGPTPRVVFSLSNDPGKQISAIRSLAPIEAEGNMEEALGLASAIVSNLDSARIVVLSDGCFGKIENFYSGKATVSFQAIGKRQENSGIYALGAAKTQNGTELFCGVKNYGLNKSEPQVDVFADGNRVYSTKLSIRSLRSAGFTCKIPPTSRVATAKITTPDLLLADNQFTTLIDPNLSIKVLLLSSGNPFLERALLLDPRVNLDRAGTVSATLDTSKYDLVIFDGINESSVKSRSYVTIPPPGKGVLAQALVETRDPLLESVNLSKTYIETASPVTQGGTSLLDSSAGPLMTVKRGDQTAIRFGFNFLDSDFPLQVGFPILIANILDELGKESEPSHLVVKAAKSVVLRADSEIGLTDPKGDKSRIQSKNGSATLRNLNRTGDYQLNQDGKSRTLSVNLQSEAESNIAVKKQIEIGNRRVAMGRTPVRMQDLWKALLSVLILLLCLEWWFFARKS